MAALTTAAWTFPHCNCQFAIAVPVPEPPIPPSSPHPSRAALWRPLTRFVAAEARLAQWAARRTPTLVFYEFLRFGVKQAWACLFGALMLALIVATYLWYPKGAALARYDFLVLAAIAVQALMLATRVETWEEAEIIAHFHLTGTASEIL